jgi:hypothetical protein
MRLKLLYAAIPAEIPSRIFFPFKTDMLKITSGDCE